MRILFVGNQGGDPVVDLNCAVAQKWAEFSTANLASFAVWFDREADRAWTSAPNAESVLSYETFLRTERDAWKDHLDRLSKEYSEVNWSAVVLSERSFTDTSFLLGAGGNRREDQAYVSRITVNIARFIEKILTEHKYDAIVRRKRN